MKINTKKTLGYYWEETKRHKLSFVLTVLTAIGGPVVGVIIPWYYKRMFDNLALGTTSGSIQIIMESLAWVAVLYLIRWVLQRANGFTFNYFETKALANLAIKCFSYLHRHSFAYFNDNFVGTLTKRVSWFVRAFEGVFDQIIFNIIPTVVSLTLIIAVLSQKSIYLSIGLTVWAVIFLIISWIFSKFKLKYDLARSEAESAMTGVLADTITNNVNVKLFNGYKREVALYTSKADDLAKKKRFSWDLYVYFEAVQAFLSIVLEVGIFYFAVKLWQRGVLTIGDFVLIQAYILTIMESVWSFNRVLRVIYENLSDAEEMTVILSTPHDIKDAVGAKKLKIKSGRIDFENVAFKYGEKQKLLNQFDLKVKPGERLAIIGPSGAGKSTVIKLLFRMYDVSAGKILIDGQDISKVTQESLWQNVSLVPQDPILFHRSLKENIKYGQPDASDKEIIAAAKAAHCHEFISKMEAGYDTLVGERGVKLSGGERQRVAIARAILKNAPILILDEATSSLDSESEGLIQDALDKLMRNKTVIVIAHRLSTIRMMDRIITVDNGKIIEDGSHGELSNKKGGVYAKLWKLQAGGFIK
jgi:ATP-binding cassette subfamily B protein